MDALLTDCTPALHERALNRDDFPDDNGKRTPTVATAEQQTVDDDNSHNDIPRELSYDGSTHKWFVYGKHSEKVYRRLDGWLG